MKMWNYPNGIEPIMGNIPPANACTTFLNYKGSHSVVLLAVGDAEYRWILGTMVATMMLVFCHNLYSARHWKRLNHRTNLCHFFKSLNVSRQPRTLE